MNQAPLINDLIPRHKTIQFSDKPVAQDDVLYLLQVARLAPSARNKQIWFFTIISDRELIRQVAKLNALPDLAAAPVLIAAQARPGLIKKMHPEQPFAYIDIPISMSHLSLAAAEKSLALEWLLDHKEQEIRGILDLDFSLVLVALGFLGFPEKLISLDPLPTSGVFRNEFGY